MDAETMRRIKASKPKDNETYIKVYFRLKSDCECDKESDRYKHWGCECDPDGENDRSKIVTLPEKKGVEFWGDKEIAELLVKECITRDVDNIIIRQTRSIPYKWLNVYHVSRQYGGPEEGGWYYDAGTPELSIPLIPSVLKHYEEIRAELEETYSNEGRRPLGSVLSDGEWQIKVQYEQAREYPEERPHYE